MRKDNFVLYLSQYKSIQCLSLEDKGRLLDSLFYYLENEEEPNDLPPLVYMAFSFIRTQIDIDTNKYVQRCEKNKYNIRKRWEQSNTNDTNAYVRMQSNTNDTDKDTDKDKDKESTKVDIKEESKDSKKESEKSTRFIPPSLSEVQSYVLEKSFSVNASNFIDFYESKGWMVGKNKMKDWKASVRTWQRKSSSTDPKTERPETASLNTFEKKDYSGRF